jgi:hypothetical protein
VKRKVHTNPVFRSYIRKKMERIKKLKKWIFFKKKL